ncbi:MAG: ABC transporter ATP-binding protein [Roseiarcus sp.]|jgi:ATP-binding cassette subfamily B protein
MLDRSQTDEHTGAFRLLNRLRRDFGREHLRGYVLSAVQLSVIGLCTTGAAALMKPVTNGMVAVEKFGQMRILAFEVVALFVLRGAATFGSTLTLSRIGNRIVATAQRRVFDRLLNQSLMFFQDRHSSEFVARLVIAANGVRDSLQLVVQSGARDLVMVIGLAAVMIYRDPIVAASALCVLPILILIIRKIIEKVRRFAKRSFYGSTQIMQTMSETVLGARIVKAFNLESEMRERMARSVRTVEGSANRIAVGNGLTNFLSDALAGLAIGFAIYYGSWRVSVQHADVGSFISFLTALLLAYEPAKRLSGFSVNLQNGLVSARLIYEVLDSPPGDATRPGAPPLRVTAGRLTLEGARFAYRPGENALDGVDLVAESNQTTALVGPSGGGKSTILGVIQRFYALSEGQATIDGQSVADVDLASLRAKIAFVSQDVFLFRGTIRDNIALGRIGATEAEIVEAARRANAHDFIMSFADGYDASVGEQGTQLSGGQRQRIAIARAMLKNAPILLLDEPTAALDSQSEREVQTALDALRIGRTTMVVAHRLQTIVGADRIYVIEKGRAIESGSHKELVARGGAYCAFFAAQFGLGALKADRLG